MLVHIGHHKAASSWLQANLFDRTDKGFKPLCRELDASGRGNSKSCAAYFFKTSENGLKSSFEDGDDKVAGLLSSMVRSGGGVPVISSERLSGNPHAGAFDAKLICERLYKALPEAKIFIVVREQVNAAVSCYFTYLKCGGTQHYSDYILGRYDGRVPGFSLDYLCYDLIVGHYKKTFGADRVLVLPMEMLVSDGSTFIDHLADFCGAEIPRALPYSTPVNRGGNRYIEFHTRSLNALRRSDSVNGHVFPVPRWMENAMDFARQPIRLLFGAERGRKCEYEIRQKIRGLLSERLGKHLAASNRSLEAMTGLSVRDTYGYF